MIDRIRGAYGEVGRVDFGEGDPKPDMPDTLYRLLEDVETVGRTFGSGGGVPNCCCCCRFPAEGDLVRKDDAGGVVVPP